MVDKNLDIKQIQNIESFDILKKICEENNFFKYINKFALENLNLKKIKNFLIACIEEKNYSTNLTSLPYKLIVDPTNACNLGCPLCPTGLGASERKKVFSNLVTSKELLMSRKIIALSYIFIIGENQP